MFRQRSTLSESRSRDPETRVKFIRLGGLWMAREAGAVSAAVQIYTRSSQRPWRWARLASRRWRGGWRCAWRWIRRRRGRWARRKARADLVIESIQRAVDFLVNLFNH